LRIDARPLRQGTAPAGDAMLKIASTADDRLPSHGIGEDLARLQVMLHLLAVTDSGDGSRIRDEAADAFLRGILNGGHVGTPQQCSQRLSVV